MSTARFKKNPDISVNIVVFNGKDYLVDAINSILSQSFQDFELIIVDDGSFDGSWEILEKFARQDNRIKLFQQKNSGVGAARNLAFNNSKGRYIAIMDADDVSLPRRLEVERQFLDTHPDIAGCGSQWLAISPKGEVVALDYQPSNPDIVETLMFAFFTVHHPTMMVRREAMTVVNGYNASRRLASDYDLFSRMLLAGLRFANIPQVLFQWRLTHDGLTATKAKEQTHASHEIRESALSLVLQQDACRATGIAQKILMSFPDGTWFDEKLKRVLPDQDRSYLFNALKNSAQPDAYFSPLEYRILDWFENQLTDVVPLVTALKRNGLAWFASQVEARSGLLPASDERAPIGITPTKAATVQLSVLVPYSRMGDDLFERIANIRECTPDNTEIVVFPDSPESDLACSHVPQDVIQLSSEALDGVSPWEAALRMVSGRWIAYLEPNVRFDCDSFLSAFNALVQTDASLVYVPADRYYLEAVDEHGMPFKDPTPHPRWTQDTLLGRDRIILSGFCHRREMLEYIRVPLAECGATSSYALAMALAHRRELIVIEGRHREYVLPVSLENRVVIRFKECMLHWYFDSALGSLPNESAWDRIDDRHARIIAERIENAWLSSSFRVHWKNRKTVQNFFIKKVSSPFKWRLFREFARRDTQAMIEGLQRQGRILDRILCLAYSAIARILYRLGRSAF